MARRPGPLLQALLRGPRFLFHHRRGSLLGHRFLLLNHVGRHSGRQYETVLEVVAFDASSEEPTVMSGWGRGSDWYRNVVAAGGARITIAGRTRAVTVRVLDDDDAVRVLASYERRNRLIQPVVRLVLGQLAGMSYDGSDESRRLLVGRLPLVAFTPVGRTIPQ